VKPGIFCLVRFALLHDTGVTAGTGKAFVGGFFDRLSDFRFVELHHPVGSLAVDPCPGQKLQPGFKKVVGGGVIKRHRIFPVVFDAVFFDHLFQVGEEDLHIKVFFSHNRTLDGPFIYIEHTQHVAKLLFGKG